MAIVMDAAAAALVLLIYVSCSSVIATHVTTNTNDGSDIVVDVKEVRNLFPNSVFALYMNFLPNSLMSTSSTARSWINASRVLMLLCLMMKPLPANC